MILGNRRSSKSSLWQRIRRLRLRATEPTPEQKREQKIELLAQLAAQENLPKLQTKNVEKLRGIPSFYQSQRSMARVHAKAPNGNGFDGAGTISSDHDELVVFAKSHEVACCPGDPGKDEVVYVAHCFYGEVGLIEKIDNSVTSQYDLTGNNLGAIRPQVSGDPEATLGLGDDALDCLLADSAKLSVAIPRPYAQLTWISSDQPTLVALEVSPERLPYLTRDEDARLGMLFYDARARMMIPIAEQGALTPRIEGGVFAKESKRV